MVFSSSGRGGGSAPTDLKAPCDYNVQKGQVCTQPREERREEQGSGRGRTQVRGAQSRHRRDTLLGAGGGHGHGPPEPACCPSTVATHLGSDSLLSKTGSSLVPGSGGYAGGLTQSLGPLGGVTRYLPGPPHAK